MAAAKALEEAAVVSEPLITRDEIIAVLFNVADIAVSTYNIERLLEDDDGEEEADEG